MNKRFFRNTLPADLEAIASIASMGVLEPISGLAGIAGTLLPGEKGQGADWVRKVQGMAYEPKNPETLQQIGSALQYPLDMYEKGTDWLGDKGNQIAGPAGGAIGKSLPEILGATFVAGKLLKGAKLPKPSIDDGNFDKSRRELLKKAGIAGGALALGNKFVPDSLPALLDAAPAATTAAKSVASAATKIPAESLFSYRNVAFLKALAGKMGKKEFNKFLDDIESGNSIHETAINDNFLGDKDSLKAAIDAARKDKIHLDPEDVYYTKESIPEPHGDRLLGPFPEFSGEELTTPSLFAHRVVESIDDAVLHPDNIKKDLRHLRSDNDLNPSVNKYIDELLESDDPLMDLMKAQIEDIYSDAGGSW